MSFVRDHKYDVRRIFLILRPSPHIFRVGGSEGCCDLGIASVDVTSCKERWQIPSNSSFEKLRTIWNVLEFTFSFEKKFFISLYFGVGTANSPPHTAPFKAGSQTNFAFHNIGFKNSIKLTLFFTQFKWKKHAFLFKSWILPFSIIHRGFKVKLVLFWVRNPVKNRKKQNSHLLYKMFYQWMLFIR